MTKDKSKNKLGSKSKKGYKSDKTKVKATSRKGSGQPKAKPKENIVSTEKKNLIELLTKKTADRKKTKGIKDLKKILIRS